MQSWSLHTANFFFKWGSWQNDASWTFNSMEESIIKNSFLLYVISLLMSLQYDNTVVNN